MPISGISEVNKRFKELTKDIAGNISQKTLKSVLLTGAAEAARLTPIDTSNLINSQFTVTDLTSYGWVGTVGYTSSYARYVHGAKGTLAGQPRKGKGKTGNYWEPSGEPEFLRKAFEVNKIQEIRQIIIDGYRIK